MRQPLFFSPVCDFVGDVLSRRPASAVRFGDRLAPSAGRHLTGQKGLGRPLRRPRLGRFSALTTCGIAYSTVI